MRSPPGPRQLTGAALLLGLCLSSLGAARLESLPSSPGQEASPDTVLRLDRGERVEVRGLSGRVRITGWEGPGVSASSTGRGAGLRFTRMDGGLRVEGRGRRGSTVLRVPPDTPLEVRGRDLEVEVRGLRAAVDIRTVDGMVRLEDVVGSVEVHTVDGRILLLDVEGVVRAMSVDEDVRVLRGRGRFHLVSTDADVEMMDVEGPLVEGSSTDGDVMFKGRVPPEGTVRLSSHGGDLDVVIPEGQGARIRVATFGGSFEPAMPLETSGLVSDRETEFVLDGGGGTLELKSFAGDIRLSHGR